MQTGGLLSAATMEKVVTTLRIIMREAKYHLLIKENPVADVVPWHGPAKERKAFTPEEIRGLFPEDPERLKKIWLKESWATYFYLMLTCGLRNGEVSALRWKDWYREEHGLIIKHAVENRSRRLKGLKTEKNGVKGRGVSLTARAESMLIVVSAQRPHETEDLIFHVKGRAIIPDVAGKHFRGACLRAKIDRGERTPYSLLHAFVTLMLERTYVLGQPERGHRTHLDSDNEGLDTPDRPHPHQEHCAPERTSREDIRLILSLARQQR